MNTQESSWQARNRRFIEGLYALARQRDAQGDAASNARATLAALRRGLGKEMGTTFEMYRYMVPRTQGLNDTQLEAYYLIAALFASHGMPGPSPEHGQERRTTLGVALRHLWLRREKLDSTEKRFVAILNCNDEDLPDHLRHAVALLKSKEIVIDWLQLLKDVQNWGGESRWVQQAWARDFWSNDLSVDPDAKPLTEAPSDLLDVTATSND